MTTETYSERDALYAAICAEPEDDTRRLAYADWLDEYGDDTDTRHAELIRLQCQPAPLCEWEAAGKQPCERWSNQRPVYRVTVICPACQHGFARRDRERQLIGSLYAHLTPKCPECSKGHDHCLVCHGEGRIGTVSRGFVGRVRVPTLDTLFVREFNRHKCDFIPTRWSAELVARYGTITAVEVGGKKPFRYIDQPYKLGWDRGRETYNGDPRNVLPPFLFDSIPSGNVYDSEPAALDALARAVCRALKAMCATPA